MAKIPVSLRQSNVIFGALFIAFIIYVTAKGELPTYIGLLTGKVGVAGTQQTSIGTLPTSIDGAQVVVAPVNENDLLPDNGSTGGIFLNAPSSAVQ